MSMNGYQLVRVSKYAIAVSTALSAGILLVGLCACSETEPSVNSEQDAQVSTGFSFSRAQMFSSLEDLSSASDAIIVGNVMSQSCVYDIDQYTPFTLAEVEVASVEKGSIKRGETIIVRQTALLENSLVVDGDSYLFYLMNSGLDGDLGNQYYITGATAGLYRSASAAVRSIDSTFERVDLESGDSLPESVSTEEVESAI